MNKKIIEMIEYPKEGISSKVIAQSDDLEVTLFCMAKDTDISNHTSTKAGTVYVVEGDGVFNLEGEDIEMKAGTLIFMKKDAVHSLRANENTTFVLTLINNIQLNNSEVKDEESKN